MTSFREYNEKKKPKQKQSLFACGSSRKEDRCLSEWNTKPDENERLKRGKEQVETVKVTR